MTLHSEGDSWSVSTVQSHITDYLLREESFPRYGTPPLREEALSPGAPESLKVYEISLDERVMMTFWPFVFEHPTLAVSVTLVVLVSLIGAGFVLLWFWLKRRRLRRLRRQESIS